MHPKLQTCWQELASHIQLLSSLEKIVGPNPAILEFTAITSVYGATDQNLHADVVPPGSATKYARSVFSIHSLARHNLRDGCHACLSWKSSSF
jgi:hypothetical protein